MDGSGTVFLIFLLGDPHLLKGVQGGEDRAPGAKGTREHCEKEVTGVYCPFYLFPEEPLTQSMWNTVSPEVPISARAGERGVRHLASPLTFPSQPPLHGQFPPPRHWMHFTQLSYVPFGPWDLSGGTVVSRTPILRQASSSPKSDSQKGWGSWRQGLALLGGQWEADSMAGTMEELLHSEPLLSQAGWPPSAVTKMLDCVMGVAKVSLIPMSPSP